MSKIKDEASLNQQVEDLRERMRMLRKNFKIYFGSLLTFLSENDRKANIDVLESNKNSNKDEIKKLREDNKEFRQKLAHLQRV